MTRHDGTVWTSLGDAERMKFQRQAAQICARMAGLKYDADLREWVPKNLTEKQKAARRAAR